MSSSNSTSSVSSSLLGNQFANDIPMTAPLTTSSSLSSLNFGTSSSVTIDKNLLIQLVQQAAQINKSQDSQTNQKVDSIRLPDGGRYTGFVVNGKPNGNGKLTYPSGNEIIASGGWKLERIAYEGEFEDGLPNGLGKLTFFDKSTYYGLMKDGHMEGRGTYTYPSGNSNYTGMFKNNLFHGQGKFENKNGEHGNETSYTSHEGAWEYGRKNGYGKQTYFHMTGTTPVTEEREGIWTNGEPPSFWDCCSIQ